METSVLSALLAPSVMVKAAQKLASHAQKDPPQMKLEVQNVVCIKEWLNVKEIDAIK